jgi:hypothetical protein
MHQVGFNYKDYQNKRSEKRKTCVYFCNNLFIIQFPSERITKKIENTHKRFLPPNKGRRFLTSRAP